MAKNKMEKWLTHTFSTGVDTGEDYSQFQKEARADLRRQLKPYGIELHQFNKNHYEFSAVLERNGLFVYLSISDVRFFKNRWFTDVLYRSMAHDKDWVGGPNLYCSWDELGAHADALLSRMKKN